MDPETSPPRKPMNSANASARMLRYVGAALERMTKRGFSPDDPLVEATSMAYGGLKDMQTLLHYLSPKRGVYFGERE